MRTATSRLGVGKAPGPHQITPVLVKILVDANVKEFTKMINTLLINGKFPDEWKMQT